ncbi:hypothetical protein SKAU_G00341640 [Synaphobranchus kaupii]|uniref:Uncharacterized protein n=1 Tax=Synaphobranchus kaupii TaxID=118154 RepID=A0A9Q1EN36_SYNKA|nr:hypothetical protein SKAU_G00341640 [Synaphobranchus kaupii]
MVKYTKYPKDYQCEEVAAALTRAHPCLGQLGSKTGFWGWKQSLKFKMQNYRTMLGRLGHPEIRVNSLKHKREGQGKAAANIKKPRKAEVNYILLHPIGESTESLERERIALLSEVKKRDNEVAIKQKMEKTFSHRRLEIVDQKPPIRDIKDRWPALFQESEAGMGWAEGQGQGVHKDTITSLQQQMAWPAASQCAIKRRGVSCPWGRAVSRAAATVSARHHFTPLSGNSWPGRGSKWADLAFS